MKALTRRNDILINNRKMRVGDVIGKLKNLPSYEVRDFFIKQKKTLPRLTRMTALRSVLDEQVKNQKITSSFSDELNYRLNWYKEFSEFQYVSLLAVLANPTLNLLYKEELWLAILQDQEKLGIDGLLIFTLYNKSIAYDLNKDEEESIMDFNNVLDEIFVDSPGELDGLPVEKFRNLLKTSSTLVELRDIGTKYKVDVPRRIKKNELMELVIEELRETGQLTDELDKRVRKMPVMSLQRFAKDNGIKASIELKKEDIIEYIIDHVDIVGYVPPETMENVFEDVQVTDDFANVDVTGIEIEQPTVKPVIIEPSISGIAGLNGIEAENIFADMDVADVFTGEFSVEAAPAASVPILEVSSEPEVFIDPTLFIDPNTPFTTKTDSKEVIMPSAEISLPQVEIAVPEDQLVDSQYMFQQEEVEEEVEEEVIDPLLRLKPKEIIVDEAMLGGDLEDTISPQLDAKNEEVEALKEQIRQLNKQIADLLEAQTKFFTQGVLPTPPVAPVSTPEIPSITESTTNIFDDLMKEQKSATSQPIVVEKPKEAIVETKQEVKDTVKPEIKKTVESENNNVPAKETKVQEPDPTEGLTGVAYLIAAAKREAERPLTPKEIKQRAKEEKRIAKYRAQREARQAKYELRRRKLNGEKIEKIKRPKTKTGTKKHGVGFKIFIAFLIVAVVFVIFVIAMLIFVQNYNNGSIAQEGFAKDFYTNFYVPIRSFIKGLPFYQPLRDIFDPVGDEIVANF